MTFAGNVCAGKLRNGLCGSLPVAAYPAEVSIGAIERAPRRAGLFSNFRLDNVA